MNPQYFRKCVHGVLACGNRILAALDVVDETAHLDAKGTMYLSLCVSSFGGKKMAKVPVPYSELDVLAVDPAGAGDVALHAALALALYAGLVAALTLALHAALAFLALALYAALDDDVDHDDGVVHSDGADNVVFSASRNADTALSANVAFFVSFPVYYTLILVPALWEYRSCWASTLHWGNDQLNYYTDSSIATDPSAVW